MVHQAGDFSDTLAVTCWNGCEMNSSESSPGGKKAGRRVTKTPTANLPFDTWLERRLKDMFDAAASEPIPKDLLDLVEKIAEKKK